MGQPLHLEVLGEGGGAGSLAGRGGVGAGHVADCHRDVRKRLAAQVVDRQHEVRVLGQALGGGKARRGDLDPELTARLLGILGLPTATRGQQQRCTDQADGPGRHRAANIATLNAGYAGWGATVLICHLGPSHRRLTRVQRHSSTREARAALIRAVADRGYAPVKGLLEEVGNMMILTGKTLVSAIRPPYPYGSEFVGQFMFALRLCWFPLLISTIAFGYEAPGLQAANFLVLFGALDRLGGFFVLASIREFAPFVTAIVLAGVAGTAICADLGARKIREELDALQVLGVDPVKNLVVPRFLALMLVTGLLDIYALLFGIFGGVIATLVNGAPLGPFWATFFTNASVTDLWGSVLKCTLFGAIIAIVCCYKGMTASGGAEGVGRAG